MPRVTFENINEFPVGSTVVVNFGAYFPTHDGVIVAHETFPATPWADAGIRVVVEYKAYTYDEETGEESFETVRKSFEHMNDKGVGCSIREKASAAPVATKKKSPWAV